MKDQLMPTIHFHSLPKIIFVQILLFMVLAHSICGCSSKSGIAAMLDQPYEKNAVELMKWLNDKQFNEVEAFINHVIDEGLVTRDGHRYFRAILEEWFFASELLEFDRPYPVPQEILPLLDLWVEQHPDSDIAYTARGVYYIERAWEIRRRGYADTVKKKQWEPFKELHRLAKSDLEKAYALNPSNPHPPRQLIRVQRAMDASDRQTTDRYFNQAVATAPAFYWAYRAKLENMMPKWGGSWDEMFRFAAKTAGSSPPKTLLPHIYAYALEEVGKRSGDAEKFYSRPDVWETLDKIYSQIISDFPRSARWRVLFAKTAWTAGKTDKAMQLLDDAEKIDPSNYRICEYKAMAAEEQHDWQSEEKYARRLVQACPAFAKSYAMLGFALLQQGQYGEAVDIISKAIDLDPNNPASWANRCCCYNHLSSFEKAVADCTSAIQLNDKHPFAYHQRADAYRHLGNEMAAEKDIQSIKKLTQK